jgi:predicted nucleic acid-binding protein
MRAVRVAQVGEEASTEAGRQLASWRLVGVTDGILREAARLASLRLRSLDAIHLATALLVQPVEFITYDERLADAARDQGLHVIQPGLTPAVGDHPRPRRGRRLNDRDA